MGVVVRERNLVRLGRGETTASEERRERRRRVNWMQRHYDFPGLWIAKCV
jgi:hypothetical protein